MDFSPTSAALVAQVAKVWSGLTTAQVTAAIAWLIFHNPAETAIAIAAAQSVRLPTPSSKDR